ncbi:MAG: hypothetical protein JWS12_271 [Candidatus Saccharibacteria bacterium]|nr:hypothetical protein [Candidatus Saccharibacteria bacterium]
MTMAEALDTINATDQLPFAMAAEGFTRIPEARLQVYEFFAGDPVHRYKEQIRVLQDASHDSNPILDLSPQVVGELHNSRRRLAKILGIVEQNVEATPLEESAMYELSARRAAENYYVLQAYRVTDMPAEHPRRIQHAERLHAMGVELFGEPDKTVFDSLISMERQKATNLLTHGDPAVRQLAQEYVDLLPDVTSPNTPYLPEQATVDHYHNLILEVYGGMLEAAIEPDKENYKPAQMVQAFNKALDYIGASGWCAELRPGANIVNVNHEDKKVYVGADRIPASAMRMKKLLLHEVGIHVMRRILGEQTANPLLGGVGLSGNEATEEGLGVVVEQMLDSKALVKGEQHYMNIGLSLGLDGHPRDFREVFEIEWRRKVLEKVEGNSNLDIQVVMKAYRIAYSNVVRVRRGTPADVSGIAFTKDLAYYNGNGAIWKFLEQKLLTKDEFKKILTGKHNFLRADHRDLVDTAA